AWLVLLVGVPFVLPQVLVFVAPSIVANPPSNAEALSAITPFMIITFFSLVFSIWSLIWFGFLPGSVGANPYGPDPLEGKHLSRGVGAPPSAGVTGGKLESVPARAMGSSAQGSKGRSGGAANVLFGFRGRINRAKWWLSVLAMYIITIVVGAVFGLSG